MQFVHPTERERLIRCVQAGPRGSGDVEVEHLVEERLERLRGSRPDERAESLAKLARALSDPIRIAILRAIGSEGPLCVCELVVVSGRSQPSTSHHLRILDDAGLVKREKRGRWAYYSLTNEGLLDSLEDLNQSTATK